MADELETVEQRFVADVTRYIEEVRRSADEARKFARANLEAAAAEKRLSSESVTVRERVKRVGDTAADVSGLSSAFAIFSQDATMASRVMSGFSLATGLLEAPVSGLIVGVGGLASGMAAAGMGAAAFGLVAKSAISNVTPAVQAYEQALNTSGKAAKTAMTQYRQYMAALSPAQREMARSLMGAENAWNNFVQSNTSGVSKIMSQGIGLLPKALSLLRPFLAPTETALSHIIAAVKTKIGSSGFIHEIGDFAKASGPDLQKLATAAGHVIMAILGILHAFLPMSGQMLTGLDRLTAKFETWGQTLTSHSGFKSLVSMAREDMPYVISIVKNLGSAIVHLGGSMTGLSTFSNSKMLLQLADPLAKLVNWLSKANPALLRTGLYMLAAKDAASKLSPAISGIKSGVQIVQGLSAGFKDAEGAAKLAADGTKEFTLGTKLAAAATRIWTGVQAAFDAVMDANPITIIIIAIVALIAVIAICVVKFKAFRDFWKDAWKVIESAAVAAWHFLDNDVLHPIEHGIADLVNWVRSHWQLLATILATVLLGPVAGLVVFIATHWNMIRSLTSRLISDVVHFFERLPGEIIGILSHLATEAYDWGRNVVMGLLHGIEGAAGSLLGEVGHLAGDVSHAFSSVLGILSPSRVFYQHGVNTLLGYVNGIKAMAPQVRAALASVGGQTAAAGITAGGAGAAGVAGGRVNVSVPLQVAFGAGTGGLNSPQFLHYIQGVVQEAVLRYTGVNSGNGMYLPGRLS